MGGLLERRRRSQPTERSGVRYKNFGIEKRGDLTFYIKNVAIAPSNNLPGISEIMAYIELRYTFFGSG